MIYGLDSIMVRSLACCFLLSSLVFCQEKTGDMKQESAILQVQSTSSAAEFKPNAVNYLLLAAECLRQMLEDQKQLLLSLSTQDIQTKRATLAPFSGGIYGKRANVPFSGGVYGKRATLPFSEGVYGKRASLPFSGGVYGKRTSLPFITPFNGKRASSGEKPVFLNRVSIRAMPVNGGMYGRK